jgi:small GTP-binding protein domain
MSDLTQAKKLIKECRDTQNPYLDLGNCGITDLNELPELFICTHLETLILSNSWRGNNVRMYSSNKGDKNKLSSIPEEISNLKKLKELILSDIWKSGWKISSYSFLSGLPQLQSLNLHSNQITDISFLTGLTQLQSLDLSDNHISDISFLSDLTLLKSLYLRANQISDISFLSGLTQLQSLDIRFNNISDIGFLSGLTQLKSLYLRANQISDINSLLNLTQLLFLDLHSNQISDISSLSGLVQLQSLDFRENKISDISSISRLTQLQSLNFCSNQISNISFLSGLKQLQFLNLSNNQISDISSLSGLVQLQSLDFRENKISDISSISRLTQLQSLDLSNNQISDISFLSGLTQLQSLNLRKNQITEIPESIFNLNIKINIGLLGGGLCLYGNSIESPPMEILKQGNQSVLSWFKAEKKNLNEIKIILIGEPKAGKTSLLNRLKYNIFNKDEAQTDGVNIDDIKFGECNTFKKQKSLHKITGHFWDFGGQEVMNSTHQFFLTKRSVYVLVLHARNDAKNSEQIRNWVMRVKATGGDSPIIVIANQIDINPGFGFENENNLKSEFPQIKHFIKVSCSTGEGIELLKEKLEELIPTAEIFGNINKTENIQSKFRLSISLASLLGLLLPESPLLLALIGTVSAELNPTFNYKKWWQNASNYMNKIIL